MKKPSQRRLWFLILLIFATPLLFYGSFLKPWKTQNRAFLSLQELIHPLERILHLSFDVVSSGFRQYVFLKNAAKENETLKNELFLLKTRVMDYDHQIQEVSRLRSLLGFKNIYERPVSLVEVLTPSIGGQFLAVRISKGQKDNLAVGMPVVSEKGVVGQVLRSGQFFSDVQLITDHTFHLDILFERTRMRGVLQGTGQNRCRLEVHRRVDVRIGDTLVTSGIGGGFPKGLPVGEVTKISYESDDVSQIVIVQPWVDSQSLEEVAVIHKENKNIETIMETAGQGWMQETLNQASLSP